MEAAKNSRYIALDVLRGMTVAGMILVNNPGSWGHIFPPLRHAPWAGCTPTDLVFPFFLFCVGAAMAFSFAKYNESISFASVRKLAKRGLLIFLVGLLLNAFPFIKVPFDHDMTFWQNVADKFEHLRIFGVLQRIAMCYIIGGLLALWLRKPKKIITAMAVLMALEWIILALIGDSSAPLVNGAKGALSAAGQGAGAVDVNFFNALGLNGENHVYRGEGFPFDPEGLVGAVSGAATVLLGFLIGNICRKSENKIETVSRLYTIGMICLALALVLSIWLPIIKKLWTGSYVLYAGGWAITCLAFFIYFIDVRGMEKPFTPFKALGMNPLFAFVMAAMFVKILGQICRWTAHNQLLADGTTGDRKYTCLSWFYQNVCCAIFGGNNEYASLFYALCYVAVFTAMAYFLYRKKIVIKL